MSQLNRVLKVTACFVSGAMLLTACGSSQIKARKEQRDKISQSSKLYCEFVNGEAFPDVDVALNLEMAKRCDPSGQMTITGYRSPSEAIGIVYCCALADKSADNDLSKDGLADKADKKDQKKDKK